MKNTLKLFGIIVLVAVIGLSMVACSDDGGGGSGADSALNGTWVNSTDWTEKMVLNNGNISLWDGSIEIAKGTYSTSGNIFTMTFTQVVASLFGSDGVALLGLSPSKWYTKQELRTAYVNAMVALGYTQAAAEADFDGTIADMFTHKATYSVSGGTLTLIDEDGDTAVWTKQ